MTDLDFTDETTMAPLGYADKALFSGTFDGNHHTISGLVVESNDYVGLFWKLSSATVLNLIIDDTCSFTLTGNKASALCGYIQGENVFKNVVNHAKVSCTGYCGGIIGTNSIYSTAITTFKNCTNTGDICTTSLTNVYCGGIIGQVEGTINIEQCINTGNVEAIL